ncbi:GxxExxY protein [Roseiterribacter gracilis]|uniref:GxxExxY protein n=1 Tax=Roseiterribacter gracilis TaxID=2812848 RepID=UPI003B43A8F6
MHHGTEPGAEIDAIAASVLDCAFAVHRAFGPGLRESAYEQCLCLGLADRRLRFERQKALSITYLGQSIPNALRPDLIVEGVLVVEVKAVESLLPVHQAQIRTYLRLANLRLGLLINFNVPLLKNGVRRVLL